MCAAEWGGVGGLALGIATAMIVSTGSFDTRHYAEPWSIFFFVLFNVMGVIVMLNVLIAIVSDSYDHAVSRSHHLFLRSRLELAGELVLVMPHCLVRDAGFGLARGDMLSLLLTTRESRADGAPRRIGGVRHFVSTRDGYGAGGAVLLFCAVTTFLPFTLVYAAVCSGVRRFGGEASAAAVRPEAILATPAVGNDDDEYLGRIGEMEKMIKRGNDRAAEQQRGLERRVEQLDVRFDQLFLKLDATGAERSTRTAYL